MPQLLRGKSLHWDFKKHYLEQVPEEVGGIPYYDPNNHEYSYEDLQAIADYQIQTALAPNKLIQ